MQGWNVGNGAVAGVAVQALGGAPAARHSGQCKPAASAATRPSIVLTTKRGAPDPEQTMSMAWGCNSGDATAANNAMANHAITHRRSVRVTSRICMVEIIDSINMNQFDLDHALVGPVCAQGHAADIHSRRLPKAGLHRRSTCAPAAWLGAVFSTM